MTRFVPLLLVLAGSGSLALTSGCYLSHERGPRAASGTDAAVARDASVASDASIAPDGGPIECALVPRGELQVTDTAYAAHAPRIGWDGERLGVVVFESDGDIGHPIVSATRVDIGLTAARARRTRCR